MWSMGSICSDTGNDDHCASLVAVHLQGLGGQGGRDHLYCGEGAGFKSGGSPGYAASAAPFTLVSKPEADIN